MKYKIKSERKTLYSRLFIAIVLFVISLIFMSQSPLNILLLNGNSSTDI